MVRNPTRRVEEVPQGGRWHGRRIQDRVRRTESGRCSTLNHQRTDSEATTEGDQFRDTCPALSPARNAGYLLQEIEAAGRHCRGRKPQIVCHAGHVRGVSKQVDSATLEKLSATGCEVRSSRAVAEVARSRSRQQGENQEYHERPVQPCYPLGMGCSQSHHPRKAKLETQKDSSRPDDRANQGLPFAPRGALPDRSVARCCEWTQSGRIAWSQVGRRRLRGIGSKRHSLCGQAEDHPLQDRSFPQADSTR